MSNLDASLSLASDLLKNHHLFDPSGDRWLTAAIRLALCLERDKAHRGGMVRQDIDLGSLHRACTAVQRVVAEAGAPEPSHADAVRWCAALRCPVPELAIEGGRRPPGPRITKLGKDLCRRAGHDLVEKLKRDLPDTAPTIGRHDRIHIEAGDPDDKIGQLDRLIDRCGMFELLDDALQKSGKSKAEFRIAIKPNLSMIFRLRDDGTYTDTMLVLRLIERIMGAGYANVSVVETQNLYGNWYGNREVIKVAAHGGYLDRSAFDDFDPGRDYFGKVLVNGEPKEFKVIDMTYDQVPTSLDGFGEQMLGRPWVHADFRINFAKFKTHFYTYYTLLVKNTYGCLPAQDKIKHYHRKLITHLLTAAQLERFPIHFSFIDAITGADGILGAKMKADSNKIGLLVASSRMMEADSLCSQMMGYDPFCSAFFASAVRSTGDLRAVQIEGPVGIVQGWKRVPKFVNDFSEWGQRFYRLGLHFGHTFTGHNDACFPHTGTMIRLRRIISIIPYLVLWLSNLDELRVRRLRRRMLRFIRINADKLPLSSSNEKFFDSIYCLSSKDMRLLAGFLEENGHLLANRDAKIERFGHRVRVDNVVLEPVGMKHFSAGSCAAILDAIKAGELDIDQVRADLHGWQTAEIPGFLRKHLLLDSPYQFNPGYDANISAREKQT